MQSILPGIASLSANPNLSSDSSIFLPLHPLAFICGYSAFHPVDLSREMDNSDSFRVDAESIDEKFNWLSKLEALFFYFHCYYCRTKTFQKYNIVQIPHITGP